MTRNEKRVPHPGCFLERVWNCKKRKELCFAEVQKSVEEYETKRHRQNLGSNKEERLENWGIDSREGATTLAPGFT